MIIVKRLKRQIIESKQTTRSKMNRQNQLRLSMTEGEEL
jgi:hypothetical protein